MQLNERARQRCQSLIDRADEFRVGQVVSDCGTRVIDCGIGHSGGLAAGMAMAEVCLAGLGQVSIVPGRSDLETGPAIQVITDHPIAACMASQYAGWQISSGKFFAMGSGPMRAAAGREELFRSIGHREQPEHAVGVLETRKIPPSSVCEKIAEDCGITPENLTLLLAPTASLAGTIQVVARTVETCLHKLHELDFDLSRVVSGHGIAPLPPVAADDMAAIGRTNDAVLYGGEVKLWVQADDAQLEELGPGIPSDSSADYGAPFAEVFARYEYDFYRIDPLLFSPACVTLINLTSGRTHRFGRLAPDVLRRSFLGIEAECGDDSNQKPAE